MSRLTNPSCLAYLSGPRDKRARLAAAGQELPHRQGFVRRTLADVATLADVPLGNVYYYYYFETKEALCQAVIEAHAAILTKQFVVWEHGHNHEKLLVDLVRTKLRLRVLSRAHRGGKPP